MSQLPFEGRVALVNAAAGSGIGAAIVRAFLERGAQVAATDRSASRIARLTDALSTTYGPDRIFTAVVDASDQDSVRDNIDAVHNRFGRLDMLVNSVGFNKLAPLSEATLDDWRSVLDASLTSHFLHIRHAWRHLLKSDAATIVNIASLAAERPTGFGESAYAAAKAGVIGLTRAAAAEAGARIRVNAIMPGLIWNENLSRAVAEDYIEAYRSQSPLGRAGTPEEVAEVVMFLSSKASAHVSGDVIKVAC
jgi:NAD(P)-dependent dehydrogenase (short-subunit alcohol dehydrogenase family)